ncbi:MAG: hypothetical protein EOM83_06900 [Clostridia bacterium]|nr:hypothetical protein [Clostridia bacterium]
MKKFTADTLDFTATAEQVGAFASDMRNFSHIMPEQIEQWQANENAAAFTIKNIGRLSMSRGNMDFPFKFEFPATADSKVRFTLILHYRPNARQEAKVFFEIEAEINTMMEMMARRPLTIFVNLLTQNLKTHLEGNAE